MGTPTSRLGLATHDVGDPFSHTPINENWQKLDAAPGTIIATSRTLPTLTDANIGRTAYATDTRTHYAFMGANASPQWLPTLSAPSFWFYATGAAERSLPGGTQWDEWRRIARLTTSRPGTLFIQASVQWDIYPTERGSCAVWLAVDNVFANQPVVPDTDPSFLRDYERSLAFNTTEPIKANVSSQVFASGFTQVSAGTHTFGVRVDSGIPLPGAQKEPGTIRVQGLRVWCMLVDYGVPH